MLLDLKLPQVDGLEVLAQLRFDSTLWIVPVVILTSSREEQDLISNHNLGIDAYVVKPVGSDEFVTAIREVGLFWAVINCHRVKPVTGAVKPKA